MREGLEDQGREDGEGGEVDAVLQAEEGVRLVRVEEQGVVAGDCGHGHGDGEEEHGVEEAGQGLLEA